MNYVIFTVSFVIPTLFDIALVESSFTQYGAIIRNNDLKYTFILHENLSSKIILERIIKIIRNNFNKVPNYVISDRYLYVSSSGRQLADIL